MALLDHKGGAEFPYARKDVYDALLKAIPGIKGLKIDSSDELGGRVTVKAGVSLTSWGENIPVTVTEIAPGRSRVEVLSRPKTGILMGGALDFGKNQANIERILNETSKILSTKPPAPVGSGSGASKEGLPERLAKLKALYEQGLITEADYNQRKAELLSQV